MNEKKGNNKKTVDISKLNSHIVAPLTEEPRVLAARKSRKGRQHRLFVFIITLCAEKVNRENTDFPYFTAKKGIDAPEETARSVTIYPEDEYENGKDINVVDDTDRSGHSRRVFHLYGVMVGVYNA
jgi:hypothetical protein